MDNYNKLKIKNLETRLDIAETSLYRIKDLKSLNDIEYEINEYRLRVKSIV